MAFFGVAIVVSVAVGWLLARRTVEFPHGGVAMTSHDGRPVHKRQVHLYFGDAGGRYLSAEDRVIEESADPASTARALVEALILGPAQGGTRTLPRDSGLRSVFVTLKGVAYIDFTADAFDHQPGGVETEMLTIYSIVNTLVLNMERIRWVKLLIGGREAATLAGHVDLSRPFKANMLWVR